METLCQSENALSFLNSIHALSEVHRNSPVTFKVFAAGCHTESAEGGPKCQRRRTVAERLFKMNRTGDSTRTELKLDLNTD